MQHVASMLRCLVFTSEYRCSFSGISFIPHCWGLSVTDHVTMSEESKHPLISYSSKNDFFLIGTANINHFFLFATIVNNFIIFIYNCFSRFGDANIETFFQIPIVVNNFCFLLISTLVNYPPTPEAMGWASEVSTPTNVGSSFRV